MIDGRKAYAHVPIGRKLQLELAKLSFDPRDNVRMFKQLKFNVEKSTSLEVLEIVGIMMRDEAYEAIAEGVAASTSLRRFILQNCNIHEQNNFQIVCKGLA